MFGHGAVHDLFAAGAKDLDFDEGIFIFEAGGQRFGVIDAHGTPENYFSFFLGAAHQLVLGLSVSQIGRAATGAAEQ
jgi:hypothetical protein